MADLTHRIPRALSWHKYGEIEVATFQELCPIGAIADAVSYSDDPTCPWCRAQPVMATCGPESTDANGSDVSDG